MSTIVEIEKLALDLSERERAALAANLLDYLPAILFDQDDGLAEALRRDSDLDTEPAGAISLSNLDSKFQSPKR